MATFMKFYNISKHLRIPHTYKSVTRVLQDQRRYISKPPQTSNSSDVHLSESCIKRLKAITEPGSFLRVLVEGGGCSGFQYKFELDTKLNPDDRVFEKEGAKVVVDEDSLEFVKGSTITFSEELIRSAFSIESNPMAEGGCSCGASFSLKI